MRFRNLSKLDNSSLRKSLEAATSCRVRLVLVAPEEKNLRVLWRFLSHLCVKAKKAPEKPLHQEPRRKRYDMMRQHAALQPPGVLRVTVSRDDRFFRCARKPSFVFFFCASTRGLLTYVPLTLVETR
jgi:hypothetical protein